MIFLWPRQESNLDLGLRKPLYYPLYYEAGKIQWANIYNCRCKTKTLLCQFLLNKAAGIGGKYFYGYGQ